MDEPNDVHDAPDELIAIRQFMLEECEWEVSPFDEIHCFCIRPNGGTRSKVYEVSVSGGQLCVSDNTMHHFRCLLADPDCFNKLIAILLKLEMTYEGL